MQGTSARRHPAWASPAMAIAVTALVVALGGTGWAAVHIAFRRHHRPHLPPHSVGTRQLRAHAVRPRNLARNAVKGSRVAAHSLTGADLALNRLGRVPRASYAGGAAITYSLDDRQAGCPAGTILLGGTCFDRSLGGPVPGVAAAADTCAAKGGWLPNAMALRALRGALHLGSGNPPEYAVTGDFFADSVGKDDYSAMAIDQSGGTHVVGAGEAVDYVCAYPLVR
jgi:hypothetical protein